MTIMKKLIYYLAVMLIATACEKGDEKQEDQLILSDRTEQNQTAHADQMEAGEMTFIAKSSWTATVKGETQTSDVDWLHLMLGGKETYKGTAGTFTLSFKLTPNDTGVERTATITIKSGDKSIAVNVLQTQTTEDGEVLKLLAAGRTGVLSWKFTSAGVLIISGKGEMPDYRWDVSFTYPWHSFHETINSVIIDNGITSIGNNAFNGCSGLSNITIPNSVTVIGSGAFSGCVKLKNITIPNSVTEIGVVAFAGCAGLTNLTIPANITKIKIGTFEACTSLVSVVIPEGVTDIEEYAFYGCTSLTEVFIPNSVVGIGMYAFENCRGLTSVTISGSVKTIGGFAFRGCVNLADVIISHGVKIIGNHAFAYCSNLTEVNIPNSVSRVESSAFYECENLVSVTIPNSVTEIAPYTFYGCRSLSKLTIPYSVIKIGNWAFFDCTKLTEITLETTFPLSVGYSNFDNTNPSVVIYVYEQSLQAYRSDPFWTAFNLQARNQ